MTPLDGLQVMTVRGLVDAGSLGTWLPHEHVVVDFIGADQTGPDRYQRSDVIDTMLPFLQAAIDRGVTCFADCSPAYLARDPQLLGEFSERTGLHMLTNTGLYKEPFLPAAALTASAEELAERWIGEAQQGIEGTGIYPGFVKTAVNPESLAPVQQRVIAAAAITSAHTGLTIATHTGVVDAALEILAILERHGVDPKKWIFVHAQNEPDRARLLEVARAGSWVELDGIQQETVEEHLERLLLLLDQGFGEQVLLSHDGGWYDVGNEPGAKKRPFTPLFDLFRPAAQARGVDDQTWHQLTVLNPARAYAVAQP